MWSSGMVGIWHLWWVWWYVRGVDRGATVWGPHDRRAHIRHWVVQWHRLKGGGR